MMQVSNWLFSYELSKYSSPPPPLSIASERFSHVPLQGKYLLLVSGLAIGHGEDQDIVDDIAVKLLVEFLCGKMADEHSSQVASRVARVIIAGNSIAAKDTSTVKESLSGSLKSKTLLSAPSKQLDLWLAQILSSCCVDIMPGATDPANISFPQQPFHPCLFPHSSRFSTFERVTNPYECKVDSVTVLGHSGQPIADIARQTYDAPVVSTNGKLDSTSATANSATDESQSESVQTSSELEEVIEIDPKPKRMKVDLKNGQRRLEILERTLEWGYICPTAPGKKKFLLSLKFCLFFQLYIFSMSFFFYFQTPCLLTLLLRLIHLF